MRVALYMANCAAGQRAPGIPVLALDAALKADCGITGKKFCPR